VRLILFFFVIFLSGILIGQEDTNFYYDAPLKFPVRIHYQNNSAEISHISRLRLLILAEYLNENPTYKIIIEGHVCCGPAPRMSRKRAKSVYKYLIKIVASKEQMTYIGKSFDEPLVPKERNEEDKDMNRRVEIEIVN
jgi:outer membrane protein OmpA-like peptidoglycan-associated protein